MFDAAILVDGMTDRTNYGYVRFIKALSARQRVPAGVKAVGISLIQGCTRVFQLLFLPLLFGYGVFLVLVLHMRGLLSRRCEMPALHRAALDHVREFVAQYPLHLYPVVAKSLELAFLKTHMKALMDEGGRGGVELAIGDGTLSARIFPPGIGVTGFDINPYSLVHTARHAHVTQRVVADCLNPPVAKAGAAFVVANNLLHHVEGKDAALRNWARIAPYALFNENTTYWSSGWYAPFLLRRLGAARSSAGAAKRIEERSLQHLLSREELQTLVGRHYEILQEDSFFHERVFFLCSLCSLLLFCYGPPTPRPQKMLLNGLLRPFTRFLTEHMARVLIEYDAVLPRDKDAFVCWVTRSRTTPSAVVPATLSLVCPDCREPISLRRCPRCDRTFPETDQMLFLLPRELADEITYVSALREILGREHL